MMTARDMVKLMVIALASLVACGEDVTVEPLPADYHDTWKMLTVAGNAPGHSDSIRLIYANPIATTPRDPGLEQGDVLEVGMPLGSVLVKEVYEDNDGEPGALRHIAIMRKLRPVNRVLIDEGGWVFTEYEKPGDPEKSYDLCWGRCHAAAPYNGAWYDYTKLL